MITLAATSAAIAKMISDESNLSVLRDSLTAVVGGGWQIEVGIDAGPAAVQPAASQHGTGASRPARPPRPRRPTHRRTTTAWTRTPTR